MRLPAALRLHEHPAARRRRPRRRPPPPPSPPASPPPPIITSPPPPSPSPPPPAPPPPCVGGISEGDACDPALQGGLGGDTQCCGYDDYLEVSLACMNPFDAPTCQSRNTDWSCMDAWTFQCAPAAASSSGAWTEAQSQYCCDQYYDTDWDSHCVYDCATGECRPNAQSGVVPYSYSWGCATAPSPSPPVVLYSIAITSYSMYPGSYDNWNHRTANCFDGDVNTKCATSTYSGLRYISAYFDARSLYEVRITARADAGNQLQAHTVSYTTNHGAATVDWTQCSEYTGGASDDGQVHVHACAAPNANGIRVTAGSGWWYLGLAELEAFSDEAPSPSPPLPLSPPPPPPRRRRRRAAAAAAAAAHLIATTAA